MAKQYGIIGDLDDPTQLPETQKDTEDFVKLQKAARFSKTKEYQALKEHLEGRVEFYQQYLPGGEGVGKTVEEIGRNWMVADAVIGEIRAILKGYDQAAELIKDELTHRKRT